MSTESDGPLGNEGQTASQPETQEDETVHVTIEVVENPPPPPPGPPFWQHNTHDAIEWQNTHSRRGYDLLEAIILEQQAHLLRAIANNVQRHGWRDRVPDLTAAGTFATMGVATGHPIAGAAFAALAALGRSVMDTIRIRRNKNSKESQAVIEVRKFLLRVAANLSENASGARIDKVPQVAEFQILWVRSAWRLVHCLRGYNTRVEAARSCFEAPDRTQAQEDAATEILTLMSWIRLQLLNAMQCLEDLYVAEIGKTKGRLYAMDCLNDRILELNPFQDGVKDAPGLDWLPLPHDKLVRAELPAQAQKDAVAFESSLEAYVQQIDRDLANLETEHGPEVDKMLDRLRKEAKSGE